MEMKKTKNKQKGKHKSVLKKIMAFAIAIAAVLIIFIVATNIYVISYTKDNIVSENEAAEIARNGTPLQCIEVLGASVVRGKPSDMLRSRIDTGLELYRLGAADVLLFSGDNGTVEYNEVNAMKQYASEHASTYGVVESDIYLDHAGFSTYESMYRLKKVFDADSAIVVTQRYHLYRAIYTAKKMGIDVYGVEAPSQRSGQLMRDIREVLARTKDFCYVLIDKQPKYLGETINLVPGGGND